MAEHLRKRPERHYKAAVIKLGKIACGIVLVGGASAAGLGIYNAVTYQAPYPVAKKFTPTNCKDVVAPPLNESDQESQLTYNFQEDIYTQINEEICSIVNAIGKQTVNYYFGHQNLFTNDYDQGGEFDFELKDKKTGGYDEITYPTTTNGVPIYSKAEYVTVGDQKGSIYWDINITPTDVTSGGKPAVEWDLSTENTGTNSKITIPDYFDSNELPKNETVGQLVTLKNQMLFYYFDMSKANH